MSAGVLDGRGGPHLFVDALDAPELSDADSHHLVRVLRTRPGDPVTVSDGVGRWVPCVVRDGTGHLEVAGPVSIVAPPPYPLTVAFAPVKGDRPEWAVQKLTEIGVDRIVPVQADRSVVRWSGDRGDKQVERLRRVAREAAMQSRRCRLPEVGGIGAAVDLMGEVGAVVAERGGAPPAPTTRILLVGPEGGWSEAERDAARGSVDLGPNVLRAETATVVGAALLVAFREQLARPTTNSG